MLRPYADTPALTDDLRDALPALFETGLPSLWTLDWLMDRAERGDWSGLWW